MLDGEMNSNIPPDWYAQQYKLAAQELDYELGLSACESELKDGITATFAPMPQAVQQQENSVYNLNALLDSLD